VSRTNPARYRAFTCLADDYRTTHWRDHFVETTLLRDRERLRWRTIEDNSESEPRLTCPFPQPSHAL
jgi:hypothetical protein